MIKILHKLRIDGSFINLIKDSYKNLTIHIMLVENLKVFF